MRCLRVKEPHVQRTGHANNRPSLPRNKLELITNDDRSSSGELVVDIKVMALRQGNPCRDLVLVSHLNRDKLMQHILHLVGKHEDVTKLLRSHLYAISDLHMAHLLHGATLQLDGSMPREAHPVVGGLSRRIAADDGWGAGGLFRSWRLYSFDSRRGRTGARGWGGRWLFFGGVRGRRGLRSGGCLGGRGCFGSRGCFGGRGCFGSGGCPPTGRGVILFAPRGVAGAGFVFVAGVAQLVGAQFGRGVGVPLAARIAELLAVGEAVVVRVHLAQGLVPDEAVGLESAAEGVAGIAFHAVVVAQELARDAGAWPAPRVAVRDPLQVHRLGEREREQGEREDEGERGRHHGYRGVVGDGKWGSWWGCGWRAER
ncbi:unnamed protein product [Chondrus crispus]|uniref:Uncharacterized protein n=1 Tax=Chondrus crispus TaxID=2769 RepID=R7QNY3_CHOCR|nr:unnamed protein product [Chondrus crispus]CDF39196.1 unnamed protein product [Chondrus crispus]|eukprot:XP_005719107.1 unnamed protein product [Chondrus crispus]